LFDLTYYEALGSTLEWPFIALLCNRIFGKLGRIASGNVILQLIVSKCVQIQSGQKTGPF